MDLSSVGRRPRIALAGLIQESNSFGARQSTVADFEAGLLLRGGDVLTGFGTDRSEVPGFLAALAGANAKPVPLLAAWAASGGPLERTAFELLLGELEARLAAAMPVDGLLIALHGALLVEDEPDGDGELLGRLHRILPPGVPIVATLDLHAHVTPRMVECGAALIGYQTFPHVDLFETGERAGRLMLDILAGRARPVMALEKRPMLLSASTARTTDGPLAAVADAARRAEAAGRVRHASIFPVQPWIDVPGLGFAVLACADDPHEAACVAGELADAAWSLRHEFTPTLVTLEEAIRIGLAGPGLTVVSDGGDAPTSGAGADDPSVLQALLDCGAQSAPCLTYVSICDASAAGTAVSRGVGSELALAVGRGAPVLVEGRVLSVSDGTYSMTSQALTARMGPTAILAIDSIRLLVRSLPSLEWDAAMYTSQGLDPRAAALVFVKSPSGFRNSYGPIADRIILADTPGAARANPADIDYRRVTRPLFPLDPI